MQLDLSSDERSLILIALLHPIIKESVQEPATPKKVRDTWKGLIEKLKKDEQLHIDMAQSTGGRLIVPK